MKEGSDESDYIKKSKASEWAHNSTMNKIRMSNWKYITIPYITNKGLIQAKQNLATYGTKKIKHTYTCLYTHIYA